MTIPFSLTSGLVRNHIKGLINTSGSDPEFGLISAGKHQHEWRADLGSDAQYMTLSALKIQQWLDQKGNWTRDFSSGNGGVPPDYSSVANAMVFVANTRSGVNDVGQYGSLQKAVFVCMNVPDGYDGYVLRPNGGFMYIDDLGDGTFELNINDSVNPIPGAFPYGKNVIGYNVKSPGLQTNYINSTASIDTDPNDTIIAAPTTVRFGNNSNVEAGLEIYSVFTTGGDVSEEVMQANMEYLMALYGVAPPAQSKLRAWWDATDTSTVTIATGVSQWADKSGNGNHLVQATGAAQPGYTSGVSVDFTASAYLLQVTNNISGSYDAIAVATSLGSNATWRTLFRNNTIPAINHPMLLQTGTDVAGAYASGAFRTSGLSWPISTQKLVMLRVLSGANDDISLALDGDSLTPVYALASGTNIEYVGNNAIGAQPFGNVNEILIYDTLTEDERALVDIYMTTKWGL